MLTEQRTNEIQKAYHNAMERADEILENAVCELLKKLTGKEANARFREKLGDAIRFDF